MRLRLREILFLCFALVTVLLGTVTTLVGVHFIGRTIEREAQTRVEADLRIARLFLNNNLTHVQDSLAQVPSRVEILSNALKDNRAQAEVDLEKVRLRTGLDFLSLTDEKGVVVARSQYPNSYGDDLSVDPIVADAIKSEKSRAGIEVLSQDRLKREADGLPIRAYMRFEPTPRAKPRPESEETAGMAMEAVVPIPDSEGRPVGYLVGGLLLNRNFEAVDAVKNLVFQAEEYDGKEIGTVTIFQWDLRISTNVTNQDGTRAIGTRVSEEVYDRVLENGLPWYGRAFVVNDWYITAYEPIRSSRDKIVGILYVGILAREYDDYKRHLTGLFLGLTGGAVLVVILLSFFLSRGLSKPMQSLVEGTRVIANGKLDWRVRERGRVAEVIDLTHAFNVMAGTIEENDQRLRVANANLERANRNYMEMLGFVSHELKNPLSSSTLAAHSLSEGMVGALNDKQQRLADLLCRNLDYAGSMVANYLDLSRIEKGELKVAIQEVDLREDVVAPVVNDLSSLAENRKMTVEDDMGSLTKIHADPNLLRVVYQNLIGNAIRYGREEGRIILRCREEQDRRVLSVYNEGVGISEDQRHKLFKKFSRIADPKLPTGKGTGLGLFITRNIVLLHGGEIWVEGEEGKYVEFVFSLPRGSSPPLPETAT